MNRVFVGGVGMTAFRKDPDRTLRQMAGAAALEALADTQMIVSDLDQVFFANAMAGRITDQEMVAGQVALRHIGVSGTPVFNVENACASGSSAFNLAYNSIAGGGASVVLVVGAEKMLHADKKRTYSALAGALDVEEHPLGGEGSPFMELYASMARKSIECGEISVHDLAAIAVKNHANGLLNSLAQYGATLTVDEVLASRSVVSPLTLLMCSPVSDGAAAVVLVSEDVARRMGRCDVYVAASVVRSGRAGSDGDTATEQASAAAYEAASLAPSDIDLAEIHDAAAPAEIHIYEELGFARPGHGASLINDGITLPSGRLPVNVSGGLIARGHPVGATGIAQLYEAVLQLRGVAGVRQIDGVRVALTQNGGGWIDADNAAAAVTILKAN